MTRAEAQRRAQAIASDVVTRTTLAWIADQRAAGRPLEDAHVEIARSAADTGAAITKATGQIAALLLAGATAPHHEGLTLATAAADEAETRFLAGIDAAVAVGAFGRVIADGCPVRQADALVADIAAEVAETLLVDMLYTTLPDAAIEAAMRAVALRLSGGACQGAYPLNLLRL